jgi:hypothetical protein
MCRDLPTRGACSATRTYVNDLWATKHGGARKYPQPHEITAHTFASKHPTRALICFFYCETVISHVRIDELLSSNSKIDFIKDCTQSGASKLTMKGNSNNSQIRVSLSVHGHKVPGMLWNVGSYRKPWYAYVPTSYPSWVSNPCLW